MMKRLFVILISCLWLAVPLSAQSNKLIRELESRRGALQKQIAESESILKNTKKDVGSQLNSLAALTGQIEERKRYILAINNDVEAIERELNTLERQLRALEKDLKDKKRKYEASVQYLYKNKSIEEKLMFIFSAKNLGQTYRRMRYVREYATYQRLQGEEILKKQEQIRKKKAERQQVKAAKENLLKERILWSQYAAPSAPMSPAHSQPLPELQRVATKAKGEVKTVKIEQPERKVGILGRGRLGRS